MLTFEEDEHIYRWDGDPVPGVTRILGEWVKVEAWNSYVNAATGSVVNADILEAAGDSGTAVHLGVKLLLTCGLDWEVLDTTLVAPLKEFLNWKEVFGFQPEVIEKPMFSAKHRFAGTPDLIGTLRGVRGKVLVDIKTGRKNSLVGPQTAAYEILYRETTKYRGQLTRYELILPRDGGACICKQLTDQYDGAYFLSKLFQHNVVANPK